MKDLLNLENLVSTSIKENVKNKKVLYKDILSEFKETKKETNKILKEGVKNRKILLPFVNFIHYFLNTFIFSGKLYFNDVLEQIYAFLQAHPSETVIFSVKDEDPKDDAKEFESLLFSEIRKNRDRWYLHNTIPSLGAVRGKVVLASRFSDVNTYGDTGINLNWESQDNTDPVDLPYEVGSINGTQKIWVQDRYHYNTEEKIDAVRDMIANVQADDTTFTLNFLSTVGDGWMTHPKHYADIVNDALLKTKLYPNTSYGVIIVDFGTKDIAQHIYMSNFKAQEPKGEEE
jgi:1-phosphatidylinositol phosphodiesterase